jgi:hypothetical protein
MGMRRRIALVIVLMAAAAGVVAGGGGEQGPRAASATGPVLTGSLPVGGEQVRLDPGDFTTRIDSPYFPLTPGDRRVYRVTDAEGLRERDVVTVTSETKVVANGVTARVVLTEVREEGKLIEDNQAWYAQDRAGNVWYFGERAREIENGRVTSTKGSWEAGVGGAQPGVIMAADPRVGLAYREEEAKGVAQDRAIVFSLGERAQVPFRSFKRVLLIKESEPIQRSLLDYKFYARGVGKVLGIEVSGGTGREELVRFTRGG